MTSTTHHGGGAVVFSVTNIGDLIQATLTFEAIARRIRARPTLVTAPAGEVLMRGNPHLERVDVVRSSHPIGWRVETARHLVAARRRGARVVNLEVYPPRWKFVRRFCRLFGLEAWTLDLPALLRESVAAADRGDVAHVSSYYARTVGIDAPSAPLPQLFVSPGATARIAERLGARGADDGRPRLVVHPGSSARCPEKRARPERFSETLRGILGDRSCTIVMVGSREEREICERIRQDIPATTDVRNWAGDLTVDELAALLASADVFIGNDSGPAKIAEAVGTSTLSFWGPTSPRFIGPRGSAHVTCGFEHPVSDAVAGALGLLGHGRTTRRAGGST
jgi:ADP-heptose:LPS heptosyltransferase